MADRISTLAEAIDALTTGLRSNRNLPDLTREIAMSIRRDNPADYLIAHRPDTSADAVRIFELDRLRGPEIYNPGGLENWAAEGGAEGGAQLSRILRNIRGNPDAIVPIYRGTPSYVSNIESGDWVSGSLPYAREHALSVYDPSPWLVLRADVPARDIVATDYLGEFGYIGEPIAPAVRQLASRGIGTRPVSKRTIELAAKGDAEAIQAIINKYGLGQLLRQNYGSI